jgi:Flp pilus assembly secretin CpaC
MSFCCRSAANNASLHHVSSTVRIDASHDIYFTTAAIVLAATSMAMRLVLASRLSSCDGLELELDRSFVAQPHQAQYIVLTLLTFGSIARSPIETNPDFKT